MTADQGGPPGWRERLTRSAEHMESASSPGWVTVANAALFASDLRAALAAATQDAEPDEDARQWLFFGIDRPSRANVREPFSPPRMTLMPAALRDRDPLYVRLSEGTLLAIIREASDTLDGMRKSREAEREYDERSNAETVALEVPPDAPTPESGPGEGPDREALRAALELVLRHHLPVAPWDGGPVLCICDVKRSYDGPIGHRLHVADAILAALAPLLAGGTS